MTFATDDIFDTNTAAVSHGPFHCGNDIHTSQFGHFCEYLQYAVCLHHIARLWTQQFCLAKFDTTFGVHFHIRFGTRYVQHDGKFVVKALCLYGIITSIYIINLFVQCTTHNDTARQYFIIQIATDCFHVINFSGRFTQHMLYRYRSLFVCCSD